MVTMSINYKVEGGFDFYAALQEDSSDEAEGDVCLLSGSPLTPSAVCLPCGHSFNYYNLFREIRVQKRTGTTSHLEDVRLRSSQFKCPYCRTVFDKLIPFVAEAGVSHLPGVNSTVSGKILNVYPCKHVLTRGARKGEACGKCSVPPFERRLCASHAALAAKLESKEGGQTRCLAKISRGPRKGMLCGTRCVSGLCSRHTPKN